MNPERFAAELPGAVRRLSGVAAAGGRRFDDVVGAVPNLATENTLDVRRAVDDELAVQPRREDSSRSKAPRWSGPWWCEGMAALP